MQAVKGIWAFLSVFFLVAQAWGEAAKLTDPKTGKKSVFTVGGEG